MRLVLEKIWRSVPLKGMWIVTLACLLIGEAYPFSNFPMFGNFSGKTWYVYLADEAGKAIPAMDFGVPTNGLKKAYDANLNRIKATLPKKKKLSPEQERAAAEETLRYLIAQRSERPSHLAALRLVRVDVRMRDGKMVEETRTAGEVALR
ncbi:MAG TPA: hypothetical protein VIT91_06195 [Chthoniobacterales bacterium]